MKFIRKLLATVAVAGALSFGIAAPAVAVEFAAQQPVATVAEVQALAGDPLASFVAAVAENPVVSEWVIPSIPPVLLLVLNFLSPYIVSLINELTKTASANVKRAVAVITSFVISGGVLGVALWVGWVPLDNTPIGIVTLIGLALVLQQTAYERFLRDSATALAARVTGNDSSSSS